MLDMLCHWRYVLDNLFGDVKALSCLGATHIKKRWDEQGNPYDATADDAAYATFELEGGIVAHMNSDHAEAVELYAAKLLGLETRDLFEFRSASRGLGFGNGGERLVPIDRIHDHQIVATTLIDEATAHPRPTFRRTRGRHRKR